MSLRRIAPVAGIHVAQRNLIRREREASDLGKYRIRVPSIVQVPKEKHARNTLGLQVRRADDGSRARRMGEFLERLLLC